jgi:hypothetical protein
MKRSTKEKLRHLFAANCEEIIATVLLLIVFIMAITSSQWAKADELYLHGWSVHNDERSRENLNQDHDFIGYRFDNGWSLAWFNNSHDNDSVIIGMYYQLPVDPSTPWLRAHVFTGGATGYRGKDVLVDGPDDNAIVPWVMAGLDISLTKHAAVELNYAGPVVFATFKLKW